MPTDDPAVFYIALILPGLFALTLILEGVNKILRDEPGWVSIMFGIAFILAIILAYFFLLR